MLTGRTTRQFAVLALGACVCSSALADDLAECRRATLSKQYVAACDRIISGGGGDRERALAYRYRGDARVAAGATTEAINDYSEAIRLQPANALALGGRARAFVVGREYTAAERDYSDALKQAPNSAWLYLERGHVRLVAGNTAGAIADLNNAITLEPGNARAYNNRGLVHRRAGNLDQAHSDYTRAIQLNPIYATAYANRGYLEAARGRNKAAAADLQTALLLDRSLTSASAALAKLGVKDDLGQESEQRVQAGKAIVEANCSGCHAVGSTGASPNPKAPEFRALQKRHPLLALREPLTRGIAAPHDQMPKFALSEAQVDSIVAYINSLGPEQ
ncbi:MAG: hypothetical protein RLZ98_1711 [Pseudomonadota bacterium]|jgi:tetratricopeptide (TPR) repeat protein